jgi:hypothetical protein
MISRLDRDVTEMNRPWCELFGCEEHEHAPECVRCGAYYYQGFIFTEEAIWPPIRDAVREFVRRVVRLVWKYRNCDHCGKRFWADEDDGPCCSSACYEHWMPF